MIEFKVDWKLQIKKNEGIRKKLKQLENERIKMLRKRADAEIRLAELRTQIADLRRQFKIVALRRPNDMITDYKKKIVAEVGSCERCGTQENLTIHHKIPISEGGTHVRDNLQVLCLNCHRYYHPVDERSVIKIDVKQKLGEGNAD